MSVPSVHQSSQPIVAFIERNDLLRSIMEWIADRFADAAEGDTSIAWEDGEEHDEDSGPTIV